MDFFRFWRKAANPAGDAIIKPRADIQHDIAIMHRPVGLISTMHPKHPKKMLVRRWQSAKPHESQGCWPAGHINQLLQQRRRLWPGIDDTAAAIDDWAFGPLHHRDGFFDRFWIGSCLRGITLLRRSGNAICLIAIFPHQNIFWQVNQYRPRPTRPCHMKGFGNSVLQNITIFDQIIMFGAGAGDAGSIGLLKRIITNQMRWHLSG